VNNEDGWGRWFVYQPDGPPVGPLTAKAVAEAILVGTFPPDVWVMAPHGAKWLRAMDVPAIAQHATSVPTRRHHDSHMRLSQNARQGAVDLEGPETERTADERGPDGFPVPPPPSSSSPPPKYRRFDETLESPGTDKPQKKSQGA
jgi:hypothetical protein